MNAQDDAGAMDVSKETEPVVEATEKPKTESHQDSLIRMAREDGHAIGDEPVPVKSEEEPKTETPTDIAEVTEPEKEPDATGVAEGEDVKEPEKEEEKPEEKPAAKEEKLVPLSEVLEERRKKKDYRTKLEKAEEAITALQSQLSKAVSPTPTAISPFIDINTVPELDRLESSYEKAIELADEDPDALVAQAVEMEKKNSGVDLLERMTPEQIVARAKRKAEKAIRKDIPERRTYLQQRAVADAQAVEIYPEFKDPESEFTQVAAVVAQKIMTGQAAKDPELLVAIGDYARGYLARIKGNGKHEVTVKSPAAQKVLEGSKQKISPTPTRTRSIPERKSSADLEKAEERLKSEQSEEAALEWLKARRTTSGVSKIVQRVAD